ncbi:molecular chaperone TorD family protein [Desulfurivibrio dismutans]|uniref:molecular chaperone TorD family protein n=1 Tax=Desulfurivibrio dismutans TaxID=1398908 RepID=UPI0023DA76D3|nr:molecular chaperone TorD family protein [Desulfurivibrio alkaliphilus]MDF1614596.1 molecular chaperone TorD family protein [Desulfurivibrio alkaliphilus]
MEATSHTTPAPRQLLNLAGCFDYPSAALAQQLNLQLDQLENTHVRLFINDRGGTKAPPYAGHYLDQHDRRQFMIDFSGICLERGIVISSGHPPDHIPAMLETLALLLAEAKESPGLDINSLLERYYQEWPERFAAALEEHDEVGFYAAAAAELKEILAGLSHGGNSRLDN